MKAQEQFHRDTWVEVDLDAIEHNIEQISQVIGPKVGIMAVVKANAYGHGYVQIAKTALSSGATHLAVAFIDEALFLRKQGIQAPIVVLGASRPSDAELAARQSIRLTIYSKEWLQQAETYLTKDATLLVHLKCDTGMGRLGIKTAQELKEIEKLVHDIEAISIEGIYTHFATADELDRSYTDRQMDTFTTLVAELKEKPPLVHASNSAAALFRQDSLLSIIRFGISMYGLSPSSEIADRLPAKLIPALSLHTTIVQVKKLKRGEKVSYGATYEAAEEEWIATLPIGYADGWIRKMQGFEVLVDGIRVPLVGRICMDQCMIRLPDEYSPGTRVTLIGRQGKSEIKIEEIADYLDTINYEVACAISARVPRIYWKEKKSVSVLNALM
ncbi:alanine racemase [Jeotgalibacillus campisalis]|uniref:Alanine racemase n=1 Tax=Jeotgalibacillus campisalis TaxID=220754 RepID=A0A0C2REA3_9BACL|nr:alanine racemase [Jeotgalibacillus campisalis]KIL48580.1 alanine racemase [Jeotgalibacillus campisalis]